MRVAQHADTQCVFFSFLLVHCCIFIFNQETQGCIVSQRSRLICCGVSFPTAFAALLLYYYCVICCFHPPRYPVRARLHRHRSTLFPCYILLFTPYFVFYCFISCQRGATKTRESGGLSTHVDVSTGSSRVGVPGCHRWHGARQPGTCGFFF